MVGGGIGWLYRKIYKKGLMGEPYPGTSLVPKILRATTYDNPQLTEKQVDEFLAIYDPDEREARKTGEFVAFGGLIYPGMKNFKVPFNRHDPAQLEMIQQQDTVVAIDPSYRRAAIVWVAFNEQNQGLIYQVVYVKKTDPVALYAAITAGNERFGLTQYPYYVIDPYAGGQHSMLLGSSVTIRTELQQMGIYTHPPKVLNSEAIVYGGVSNIWRRMKEHSFAIADTDAIDPEFWLEAEEYRLEERQDGVFQPVKEFDDAMDAMRYAYTTRPWYPAPDEGPRNKSLKEALALRQVPTWDMIEGSGPEAQYPSATGSMT
jgi:hypothetical protein